MLHTCHWPGCPIEVPRKRWGCRAHWYRLPRDLRDRIWASYVPGQEQTRVVSPEYLEAAKAVQDWIFANTESGGDAKTLVDAVELVEKRIV